MMDKLTPLERELLAALEAAMGLEPLLMELHDCLDEERPALMREYRAIRKQVEKVTAKVLG